MPVTYQDVKNYSARVSSLADTAVRELTDGIERAVAGVSDPYTRADIIRRQVQYYAERYGMSAKELGAQWYELCAERAGVKVDAAIVDEIDFTNLDRQFQGILRAYADGEETWDEAEMKVKDAFDYLIHDFTREPVLRNLDRDARSEHRRYRQTERAANRAGYARVPVGETCAWCLMLASLGYFYRSEETALGVDPDHYHAHCDCIAVPYSGPNDIDGYGDDYELYFDIYATARDDLASGNISPDLQRKIDDARAKHDADFRAGRTSRRWSDVNAITMVMREQQGLRH